MDPTVSTYTHEPSGDKKKNPAAVLIIIIVVVLLIAGFLIYRQSKKSTQTQIRVIEKTTPSPTEKPKIDKGTVKIQVLNGTGTPGQAGTAVDALKKAGYSADNIKTGNAKDYTHTVATIAGKTGFEEIVSDIKTALSSLFDTITVDSSPLGTDSQFDVVITTGGKLYETPTPTKAASPSATLTPSPTNTPIPTSTP